MDIKDIIQALAAMGLGGTDALTGDTTISSASLEESINGDGGLQLSWKSDKGGIIRGGTLFLGYVMKETYVPTLGIDGIYMWSPRFSEPAVLLEKNTYRKELTLHTNNSIYTKPESIAGYVEVVVKTDAELDDSGAFNDGDLAIVTNPDTRSGYSGNATLRKFIDDGEDFGWYDDGPTAKELDTYDYYHSRKSDYWRYIGGEWRNIGDGSGNVKSMVYTSAFYGPVHTIVEDVNVLLAEVFPAPYSFEIELKAPSASRLEELRSKVIMVTFDGSTFKQLITDIAEQAGAQAYFVGRRIILGYTTAYADSDFYNRFIVLGGTKNMAKLTATGQAYAPITQRLHLDEGKYPGSIIDLRADPKKEAPLETFLIFDDIYPKLNLTISTARYCLCHLLDENGDKISDGNGGYKTYAKWFVTLQLGNQPYTIDPAYIIQDKPLSLLFQSGPLTGRQFELTLYNGSEKVNNPDAVSDSDKELTPGAGECYIIIEADGDFLLPTPPADASGNGGLCPQVGNWVTLVNVAIEDRLRTEAQKELLERGMERAQLIYKSAAPTMEEERTFGDVILGDMGDTVPDLGADYKRYVVTGVQTDLFTGTKHVSYGTFKPKGLVRSAIDKIENFDLTGAAATTGKEVSATTSGGETVIYIHDGNSDNGDTNGGSTGTTSQSTTTAIRQAGGNTNIKTVYEKVSQVERGVKNADLFAELIRRVWEHRTAVGGTWVETGLSFQKDTTTSAYVYTSGKLYYNSVEVITERYANATELVAAFIAVNNVVSAGTLKLTVGKAANPAKNDLYVEEVVFQFDNTQNVKGGVRGWLYDGEEWVPILESTTAMIENLGNAIRLVVFGSMEGDMDSYVASSGIITTSTMLTAFSQMMAGNELLARAMFSLGVKFYDPNDNNRIVIYDESKLKYYYLDTGEEYDGDVSDLVAYSFASLSADRIDFTAGNFNIGANHIDFKGKTIALTAQNGLTISGGTLTMAAGSKLELKSGSTIDLSAGNVIMTAEQLNLDADDIISILADGDLGVVFKKESGSVIQMGKFDSNGQFLAGLKFTVDNNVYTLDLNANNITLNAENITWKGKDGVARDIITNTETVDGQEVVVKKFSVDEYGNVTMNNLTANNGTFTGVINATGGTITELTIAGEEQTTDPDTGEIITNTSGTIRLVSENVSGGFSTPVIEGKDSGGNTVFRLGPRENTPATSSGRAIAALTMGTAWVQSGSVGVYNSSRGQGYYAQLGPHLLTIRYGNGTGSNNSVQIGFDEYGGLIFKLDGYSYSREASTGYLKSN